MLNNCKVKLLLLVIISHFTSFSQSNTKGFNEGEFTDELRSDSLTESKSERRISEPENETEAKTNGTWHLSMVSQPNDSATSCVNMDFEDSTLNGWTGFTGFHPNWSYGCCPNYGIIDGRHTIMDGSGIDPFGGFPVVAPGGAFSVRLGNDDVNYEAEQLQQTFLVSEANSGFYYQYAVVLQDPNHAVANQPFFQIIMFDENGDTIPCSYYRVSAGQNIDGFVTVGAGTEKVVYKSWTRVTLDLNNYIGKLVTIQFTTADCAQRGHFGYAYIDCSCFESEIEHPYFCDGINPDSTIIFTAPSGFDAYEWLDPDGNTIDTTQTTTVYNPQMGQEYTVILTPFHTGANDSCNLTLRRTIELTPHPVLPDYLLKQNIFTPNNDRMNDQFVTHDFSWIESFSITIYDRWGKLVFETDDPYEEWDGKTKGGSNASDGIYYWHARYVSSCYPDAEPTQSQGFIHLIK